MSTYAAAAALLLATTPIEQATLDCERDVAACPRKHELEAAAKAEQEAEADATEARRKAEHEANLAATRAEIATEEAAEETLRKLCGKDYHRVRVGMRFKRVAQCAGQFEMVAQHGNATVYRAAGGLVRVVAGKVTSWVAAP